MGGSKQACDVCVCVCVGVVFLCAPTGLECVISGSNMLLAV